jgi:uncharacterized SAM-binding protein YcdF (DUF218 family)
MLHAVVANAIATLLEIPLVRRRPFAPRDAIVVLGAPGPAVLAERAAAAGALYRLGGAPEIIATGRGEADAIARALAPIPVRLEPDARSTAENARFVAAMIPGQSVWLVTQPFHMRRAEYLFRREGLDAAAWHIADSIEYRDRRRALRWLAREYGAWARALLARR